MRVRAAATLFSRSARTENHPPSAVSARQSSQGITSYSQILFNSYHQSRNQRLAEHHTEMEQVSAEVVRVRSELNRALNSGQNSEYRQKKMDELFPQLRKLETKLECLSKVNASYLDLIDSSVPEEYVKITHLKS